MPPPGPPTVLPASTPSCAWASASPADANASPASCARPVWSGSATAANAPAPSHCRLRTRTWCSVVSSLRSRIVSGSAISPSTPPGRARSTAPQWSTSSAGWSWAGPSPTTSALSSSWTPSRWPAGGVARSREPSSTPIGAVRADSIGRRNTSIRRCAMGGRARSPRWRRRRVGGGSGRRIGRCGRRCGPRVGRSRRARCSVQFWRLIADGSPREEAAAEVGVSSPVGTPWFRHAGGMPPISLDEPTGRYLSFAEREEIALLRAQGAGRAGDRPQDRA